MPHLLLEKMPETLGSARKRTVALY